MILKRIINFIFIFHFVWSIFIILGFIGLFFFDSKMYLQIYAFVLFSSLLGQILFHGCPLTQLEDYLHVKVTGKKKYKTQKCIQFYTKRLFNVEIADIYMTFLTILISGVVITFIFIK